MNLVSTRVPGTRARRLAATLYGYAFLRDLVLLYPVYTLLFSDTGLSVWQISTLFVIWSATGIVLEVPSGAWADAVSRRRLLVYAPLLPALAFTLWVLTPSYWAFAVGFLLWGAGGALTSGALEALVWTELDRLGATDRYARTMGRARTAEMLAVLAATLLAGPLLAVGGYPAVGAASVLVCLLAVAVATRFPEHGRPGPGDSPPDDSGADGDEEGPDLGWLGSLRAGLAEARADRTVRAAVLLVAAVTAVWGALDEYTPLLARTTGVTDANVPLLLVLIWLGATVGGLLAGPAARLTDRGYGTLLAAGAATLAAGALVRHPAGFALVAVAFCALQLATVLADARLQESITGPGRATVTSLAGMGTDVTTIVVYGGYGLLATTAGHPAAFALAAVPYLLLAGWLVRTARAARPARAAGTVEATGTSRATGTVQRGPAG